MPSISPGRLSRWPIGELIAAATAQFLSERGLASEPDDFSDGEFFEFRLGRCLLTTTTGHGDWHPRHEVWAASPVPG